MEVKKFVLDGKKYDVLHNVSTQISCPVYPSCTEGCPHIEYDVDGGYYCHFVKQWITPNL